MRLAPAVSVTASNAGAWRGLQVLLPAAAAGCVARWAALHLGSTVAAALVAALVAVALAGMTAWWLTPVRPAGLRWTGSGWQCAEQRGEFVDLQAVEVAIDLGSALLLKLHHPRGGAAVANAAWLVVTRREAGPDFRGLCVALHAPLPGDEPPTAAADRVPAG